MAADQSVWPGGKTRIGFPSNSSKFLLSKAAFGLLVDHVGYNTTSGAGDLCIVFSVAIAQKAETGYYDNTTSYAGAWLCWASSCPGCALPPWPMLTLDLQVHWLPMIYASFL